MKPLNEEIAIQKIFDICKIFGLNIPDIKDVEFYTSSVSQGRVLLGETVTLQICTNYQSGDMDLNNPNFIKTVCHELVHYNGILNHSDMFWDRLKILYFHVQNKLMEEKENGSTDRKI